MHRRVTVKWMEPTNFPVCWRDGAGEPTIAEEYVEVVLAESLAVLDAEQVLHLTRLARLLAELQNSHCDLAGDLAGRLAFSLLGFFDKARMEGQAHQEKRSAFLGFEDVRRGTIVLHGFQHLGNAGAAAQCKARLGILAGSGTNEAFWRLDGSLARLGL